MKNWFKVFTGLALMALGCGGPGGPSETRSAAIPPAVAGDVPFVVENNSRETICNVAVSLQSGGSLANWLDGELKKEGHANFKVRAGTYKFVSLGCDQQFLAATQSLTVTGPTYVSIGAAPKAPPAGYTVIVVAEGNDMVSAVAPSANCVKAGTASMRQGNDCCSHMFHNSTGTNVCD